MKKGTVLHDIALETMAAEGKCVGHFEGKVIFVTGGAPGDVVHVAVTKVKASFLEGKVVEVASYSPHRAEPFCMHFGLCGGCSWQHIDYSIQLQYKQKQVKDNLERLGGLQLPAIDPIIPAPNTKFYRNKLDYTFSAQRFLSRTEMSQAPAIVEPALGYHIPRKYDLVFDVKECFLQEEPSNSIRLALKAFAVAHDIPFFDLRKQIGFLRTVTIRTSSIGEVMVILQVTYDQPEWITAILDYLSTSFPAITSLMYVVNGKKNDSFYDLEIRLHKGQPFIIEEMPAPEGDRRLQFRVGPKSFYQTNSIQAHQLYRVAWQFAQLKGDEIVYDLYTGAGTIANFVAPYAKQVFGLEYVAESVADAKLNSEINSIGNTAFFAGDMKDLLREDFLQKHGRPDVIITDPPRAGMHSDVCEMMLSAAPGRIVYVSCNPATQARDLAILCRDYAIEKIQPVDMFPHTMHVENVVALSRNR